MKLKNIYLGVLALAVCAGFASCSDDDDDDNYGYFDGQKLKSYAFVLNEGSYGKNNAGISCINWSSNDVISEDIYYAQNKQGLGDTGQDIITDGKGNSYVVVYGSSYVAKLDKEGVEQYRADFTSEELKEYGQPRYMALDGNKLYVTAYGGYVVRLNANTLVFETAYKVGLNPEHILVFDGKVYNTNSGWGADKTVSCIDPSTRDVSTFTVMNNPDGILESNGKIYVQGYGNYDENWVAEYPWGVLDLKSGEFTEIGTASMWAENKGVIYTVHSETDWSTSTTVNHFASYDTKSGTLKEGMFVKNAPSEFASSSIFGMQFNPYNGYLYVGTSDFKTDGVIMVFDNNLNYVTSINSKGVNPKKVVFFK